MITENYADEQNSRSFRLFFVLAATIYSLIGIFYYHWGVFYFVYLFWFENFIKAIFLFLKVKSTRHIQSWEGVNSENGKQKAYMGPGASAFARICINIFYFIFIAFGLVFFVLLVFATKEDGPKDFMDAMDILLFLNKEFNFALLILVSKETIEYLRDFVVSKKYTEENKMEFPEVFGTNDLILHCSIIFGLGGSVALHNPTIGGWYGWDQWANYAMPLVLIIFKFVAGIYGVINNKNQQEKDEGKKEMMGL